MLAGNDNIDPNASIRLAFAAEKAFADGSMTERGLRREHAKGRLTIWRIANKDYTSLAAIEEMRALCLVNDNLPASGFAPQAVTARRRSSSSTEGAKSALAAARMLAKGLRMPSPSTSESGTSRLRA
jgi:hypothetical protein